MAISETKSTWFYQHRKRVLGPVDSDELRFLALTGKVDSDTLVLAAGATEWITYSESPVAVKAALEKSHKHPVKNALHSNVEEIGTTELSPSRFSSGPSLTVPCRGVNGKQNRLRLVSAAAIMALLLLALLLSSFWKNASSISQFSGYGYSGREGVQSGNQELSDGVAEAEKSNTLGELVDSTTESLRRENAKETETLSLDPVESPEHTVIVEDQSPPFDDAMGDATKSPLAEQNANDVANPLAASNPNPDRFSVALAPKQELRSTERNSKRNSTPAVLKNSNLSARSGEGREKALDDAGGSIESEKAVALGLEWLRRIQRSDGSWDFEDPGKGAQPGSLSSPLGATAMATLCFLGSGSTTRTGPDKAIVKRAFEFMISREGSEVEGTDSMYVHALVTLCLTELAAMEPEEKIYLKHAVNAVRYIEKSQDPRGGGWRYAPRTPGDTSVTGWDVMALQSGQSAGIEVDDVVVKRAQSFLDSVSDSGGAAYAYTPGSPTTASMTAVGLLCRMYLGWPRESGPLQQGIHRLSSFGVSRSDMYYNYYATIALHHFGGTEWNDWNSKMRDQLVLTQVTKGDAAGSWPVTDPHGASGGQIYQTCLSVLTLEVYYRYLPLYR